MICLHRLLCWPSTSKNASGVGFRLNWIISLNQSAGCPPSTKRIFHNFSTFLCLFISREMQCFICNGNIIDRNSQQLCIINAPCFFSKSGIFVFSSWSCQSNVCKFQKIIEQNRWVPRHCFYPKISQICLVQKKSSNLFRTKYLSSKKLCRLCRKISQRKKSLFMWKDSFKKKYLLIGFRQ